jgi:hypothetical protein
MAINRGRGPHHVVSDHYGGIRNRSILPKVSFRKEEKQVVENIAQVLIVIRQATGIACISVYLFSFTLAHSQILLQRDNPISVEIILFQNPAASKRITSLRMLLCPSANRRLAAAKFLCGLFCIPCF